MYVHAVYFYAAPPLGRLACRSQRIFIYRSFYYAPLLRWFIHEHFLDDVIDLSCLNNITSRIVRLHISRVLCTNHLWGVDVYMFLGIVIFVLYLNSRSEIIRRKLVLGENNKKNLILIQSFLNGGNDDSGSGKNSFQLYRCDFVYRWLIINHYCSLICNNFESLFSSYYNPTFKN